MSINLKIITPNLFKELTGVAVEFMVGYQISKPKYAEMHRLSNESVFILQKESNKYVLFCGKEKKLKHYFFKSLDDALSYVNAGGHKYNNTQNFPKSGLVCSGLLPSRYLYNETGN